MCVFTYVRIVGKYAFLIGSWSRGNVGGDLLKMQKNDFLFLVVWQTTPGTKKTWAWWAPGRFQRENRQVGDFFYTNIWKCIRWKMDARNNSQLDIWGRPTIPRPRILNSFRKRAIFFSNTACGCLKIAVWTTFSILVRTPPPLPKFFEQ